MPEIKPIPRLQDLPDITGDPADNQVLVWDDATKRYVYAVQGGGVTDHGALSGLADDDHTQYLLKAGGTMTGALTLAGAPTLDLHAATKLYVDTSAGAAALDDLTDVDAAAPADGDVLTWVDANGAWEPVAGGGGASDVGDLTTVGLTAANMLRVAAAGGLEERTPAQVLADIGAAASASLASYLPLAGGTMTGNINVGDTVASTLGVVMKGANRFLHNFHHPAGSTAVPAGNNIFLGENAGNFTLGSTATNVLHGSYNVGIGTVVLDALTTGYQNVGIGWAALTGVTEGQRNVGIGAQALQSLTTGNENFGLGSSALQSLATGVGNVAIGYLAGQSLATNSSYNIFLGAASPAAGTRSGNVCIGRAAGNSLTTGSYNVMIGYWAIGGLTTESYRLYIDSRTTVAGNPLVYGEFDTGFVKLNTSNAVTNVISDALKLNHLTSGTPAAGFGSGLLFQLESSTTEHQDAARVAAVWTEATHATRKADLVLSAYDTAERVGLRIRANGNAALLITSLPTSDPMVAGALWSNGGIVTVSAA